MKYFNNIMIDNEVKKLTKNIIKAIQNSLNVEEASLHEPLIDEDDINSVTKNLETNFVSSVGKDIQNFEKKLANYTKAKYVVAMNRYICFTHTC